MGQEKNNRFIITNPNPSEDFGYYLAKVFVEVHADKLRQAIVDKQKCNRNNKTTN